MDTNCKRLSIHFNSNDQGTYRCAITLANKQLHIFKRVPYENLEIILSNVYIINEHTAGKLIERLDVILDGHRMTDSEVFDHFLGYPTKCYSASTHEGILCFMPERYIGRISDHIITFANQAFLIAEPTQ